MQFEKAPLDNYTLLYIWVFLHGIHEEKQARRHQRVPVIVSQEVSNNGLV